MADDLDALIAERWNDPGFRDGFLRAQRRHVIEKALYDNWHRLSRYPTREQAQHAILNVAEIIASALDIGEHR